MRDDWIEVIYKDLVCKVSTSKQKIKQKDYLPTGKIPVVDQGQELIGGYTNDPSKILDCRLPAIVFGDHTKIVKLINFKFAPGADGTKILQPLSFVSAQYLAYLTPVLVSKVIDKGYARHYQHVEKSKFSLPPLPEQRTIVAKIEQLFSDLDNGIANLKSAKAKLSIYRQSVLKKAFEGELTKEWRSQQTDLPNKSKLVKLGTIANIGTGATPKRGKSVYWKNGTIPWITSGALNNFSVTKAKEFITETAIKETNCKIIASGSLLVAMYGEGKTRGKCSELLINATTNQAIATISFEKNSTNSKQYIKWFFIKNYEQIRLLSSGGVQPNLNLSIVKNTLIPIFSLQEQNQIVQEIESRLSVCGKLDESIDTSLKQADALRQSILKRAFEGKLLTDAELTACRKEPDWEPAEKLLEQIAHDNVELKHKN